MDDSGHRFELRRVCSNQGIDGPNLPHGRSCRPRRPSDMRKGRKEHSIGEERCLERMMHTTEGDAIDRETRIA